MSGLMNALCFVCAVFERYWDPWISFTVYPCFSCWFLLCATLGNVWPQSYHQWHESGKKFCCLTTVLNWFFQYKSRIIDLVFLLQPVDGPCTHHFVYLLHYKTWHDSVLDVDFLINHYAYTVIYWQLVNILILSISFFNCNSFQYCLNLFLLTGLFNFVGSQHTYTTTRGSANYWWFLQLCPKRYCILRHSTDLATELCCCQLYKAYCCDNSISDCVAKSCYVFQPCWYDVGNFWSSTVQQG